MVFVDGKAIAKKHFIALTDEVAQLGRTPKLTALTCAPNLATKQYLALKQRKAAEVGIELVVVELPATSTTEAVIECLGAVGPDTDGIVLQLPIPGHLDRDAILAEIPVHQDPDGFSYGTTPGACIPPVVGAIVAIAEEAQISFLGKTIVVLGQGRLVGKPMTAYLEQCGANVTSFAEYSVAQATALKQADIIVTGIGQPAYLKPAMVKEGVIIFDAGASEDGGVVRGDVHPEVAQKAALFTPVPGGIGPITIAVLLQNLVSLIRS